MNDTPETDRQWAEWLNKLKMPIESFVDFARRLERERDEARDTARWLYQHGMATLKEGASRNEWIKEQIK